MYKRDKCYACVFLFCFLSMRKIVRPTDADKIANLAQHPKSLATAALKY